MSRKSILILANKWFQNDPSYFQSLIFRVDRAAKSPALTGSLQAYNAKSVHASIWVERAFWSKLKINFKTIGSNFKAWFWELTELHLPESRNSGLKWRPLHASKGVKRVIWLWLTNDFKKIGLIFKARFWKLTEPQIHGSHRNGKFAPQASNQFSRHTSIEFNKNAVKLVASSAFHQIVAGGPQVWQICSKSDHLANVKPIWGIPCMYFKLCLSCVCVLHSWDPAVKTCRTRTRHVDTCTRVISLEYVHVYKTIFVRAHVSIRARTLPRSVLNSLVFFFPTCPKHNVDSKLCSSSGIVSIFDCWKHSLNISMWRSLGKQLSKSVTVTI